MQNAYVALLTLQNLCIFGFWEVCTLYAETQHVPGNSVRIRFALPPFPKRDSVLDCTDIVRDCILNRYRKMGGMTYGLTVVMLFGDSIGWHSIAIVKKHLSNIHAFPLKIIEPRVRMGRRPGRIEIPPTGKYNINDVASAPTFRLLEICSDRPGVCRPHCLFLPEGGMKSSERWELLFPEKRPCVDTRLPKSPSDRARPSNAIFREVVSAYTLLSYV